MDGLKPTGGGKPFADEPDHPDLSEAWRKEVGSFIASLPKPTQQDMKAACGLAFETGIAQAQQAYSRQWMASLQSARGVTQAEIGRWLNRNPAQVGRWLMGTPFDFDRFQALYTRYAGRSRDDHPLRSRHLWSFFGYLSAASSIRSLMTSKRVIRFPRRDIRLPALEAFLGLHFFHVRCSPGDLLFPTAPGVGDRTIDLILRSVESHLPRGVRSRLQPQDMQTLIDAIGWPWVCTVWIMESTPDAKGARVAFEGAPALLDADLHARMTIDL